MRPSKTYSYFSEYGQIAIGIYLNDKFGLSIGKVILMFNIILFSITALVISQDMALYFILTYIVTTKVTDLTIEGLEDFIDVIIVSDDYVKVKDALYFI